jgi:hypothetical protein
MVTQRQKNVENKTKVEAIERLLPNNKKRLRDSYVLIRIMWRECYKEGYV